MNPRSQIGIVALMFTAAAAMFLSRPFTGTARAEQDDSAKGSIESIHTGDAATVYIRGDASGTALADRVPAVGNLISRSGKIVSVDRSWVIIQNKTVRTAVPRESIAIIEITEEK